MNKLVRHRILLNALPKNLLCNPQNLRFAGTKDDSPPPPCAEPPQPAPCGEEPPPCPPPPPPCGPPCPPPICVAVPDLNNPCNYVPPENPDPDDPDMTRIKKKQCLFQQDDGIPIHLKGGRNQVYYFQALSIMGGLAFLTSLYTLLTLD